MKNLYKIPTHVAVIMDGNGRWARRRGLPRVYGHRAGAERVEEILQTAKEVGVKWLSVFAFSTENWQRPKEEVDTIMSLLVEYINKKVPYLLENNIRLRFMGRIDQLPENIKQTVLEGEEATKGCKGMNFVVALNYSGKAEIIDAVNRILAEGKGSITEEDFRKYFYIPEMPDPDLLIRTSGEERISNFMLWQMAYTEFYFTETLWPDFDREEFFKALYEYQSRERRFGKVLEV
ncbi:MAG: isoprenyl transferase [Aquificae bacterium]|nr:isoprenyl transferase [Aquificota bacterium]